MIIVQKRHIATNHSYSYGAKQYVYFWPKMAVLEQRITRKEA